MDEILTMDETFSEEEMHLMDRFQPYNDVGKGQQEHSNGKALLEEALTSIGMRQLLPQISITHTSNMSEELRHLQYPPLGGRDAFCGQMPYFSSASVFVPVSNESKNEVLILWIHHTSACFAQCHSCLCSSQNLPLFQPRNLATSACLH